MVGSAGTADLTPLGTRLLAHLTEHVQREAELFASYQRLAESTASRFVSFLITLLVEDETRHHPPALRRHGQHVAGPGWPGRSPADPTGDERCPRRRAPRDHRTLLAGRTRGCEGTHTSEAQPSPDTPFLAVAPTRRVDETRHAQASAGPAGPPRSPTRADPRLEAMNPRRCQVLGHDTASVGQFRQGSQRPREAFWALRFKQCSPPGRRNGWRSRSSSLRSPCGASGGDATPAPPTLGCGRPTLEDGGKERLQLDPREAR